jgi:hypothetical protein
MLDLELIYGVKLFHVSFGMGVSSELLDLLVSELDEVIGECILVYEHNQLNGTAQLMIYKKHKRVWVMRFDWGSTKQQPGTCIMISGMNENLRMQQDTWYDLRIRPIVCAAMLARHTSQSIMMCRAKLLDNVVPSLVKH